MTSDAPETVVVSKADLDYLIDLFIEHVVLDDNDRDVIERLRAAR